MQGERKTYRAARECDPRKEIAAVNITTICKLVITGNGAQHAGDSPFVRSDCGHSPVYRQLMTGHERGFA
jgi:hypothetical protein